MFKTFFLNLSLNKKLILMMLFLSFVLVTVLFFLYWQSEKALLNEVAAQTAELSKAIQVGVEEVTGATDETRLTQYLDSLKSKGLKEISIISNTDEIIASTNPTKVGSPVSQRKKELIIKAELGEPVSKEEGKAYNVILPVIVGESHYGYIHLKINTEDFTALLKGNFIKRVGAALFVFAIGIGIAVFLALKYTEPIHNVVEAAKKVADGDLNQRLPDDRKDEIGELMQSFNFMVQRLQILRETEHLSAVGQLSRSIAHEIRNPLNFISLSIDQIRDKYRPGNSGQTANFDTLISSMKQEIQRLNKLVTKFLYYGKPLKLNIQQINLLNILNDVVSLIKARAESDGIDIKEEYGFLPDMELDPELIKTCLFNVVTNAFQSMPDGGALTIKTEGDNGRLRLSINDTGAGVSGENLPKIFEPFFSTKSEGLGIGLATTKRVIEEHGGKIYFHSIEGKGSNVMISLPLPYLNKGA